MGQLFSESRLPRHLRGRRSPLARRAQRPRQLHHPPGHQRRTEAVAGRAGGRAAQRRRGAQWPRPSRARRSARPRWARACSSTSRPWSRAASNAAAEIGNRDAVQPDPVREPARRGRDLPRHGAVAPAAERCTPFVAEHIGFVDTVIARMVPPLTPELRAEDPSLIVVEPYKELPVDRDAFVGPIPEIVGMIPYAPVRVLHRAQAVHPQRRPRHARLPGLPEGLRVRLRGAGRRRDLLPGARRDGGVGARADAQVPSPLRARCSPTSTTCCTASATGRWATRSCGSAATRCASSRRATGWPARRSIAWNSG